MHLALLLFTCGFMRYNVLLWHYICAFTYKQNNQTSYQLLINIWFNRMTLNLNNIWFPFVYTGLPYYLNVYTKESQWELPTSPAKPDGDSSKESNQVQCAHLLVKHKNSRRPSSWREENITRTKEEARTILNGYYQKVWFVQHFFLLFVILI